MRLFRKHQKIFLLLFLVLLFFGFALLYNHNKKILAQEARSIQCGEEMPLGEAVDETLAFALALLEQSQIVVSSSLAQVDAAERLAEIPGQCQATNCTADCHLECVEPDPDNGCLREECISSCSGQPCPPFDTILAEIQDYYNQVNAANDEIRRLIDEDRQPIVDKLNEARNGLEECVNPAEAYLSEEEAKEMKGLVTCQEAKYLRLLAEGQSCYINNFFCCQ